MKSNMILINVIVCALLFFMAPPTTATAQGNKLVNNTQDVQTNTKASPKDKVTGLSIDQFGNAQLRDALGRLLGSLNLTNSQIDNYLHQDEQINLDKDSGVIKVLRTNQKALLNDYITAIIELKNANARELLFLARAICQKEGGDAEVLIDKRGNKNYLAVVCPDFQLPFLQKTLATIDVNGIGEFNDGSWIYYYKGQHRDVRDLWNIIRFYSSPDIQFGFDDQNNALLIWEQYSMQNVVEQGLAEVDIPPNRMTLEVAVYEVDELDDNVWGLDFEAYWQSYLTGMGSDAFHFIFWDFDAGDTLGMFGYPASVANGVLSNAGDWGRYRSYDLAGNMGYIDFLEARGKARLMRKATLTANSGRRARLEAVDPVASFNVTANNTNPNGSVDIVAPDGEGELSLHGWNSRQLHYLQTGQVGMLLTAMPHIGLESSELDISLDLSDVVDYTPTGAPVIEHRFFSTKMEVADGRSVVLGDYQRSEDIEMNNGAPIISDIPILGLVFGRDIETKRKKRVFVILTPHFDVCPVADAASPPEVEALANLIENRQKMAVPKNPFGFDQWLLGRK